MFKQSKSWVVNVLMALRHSLFCAALVALSPAMEMGQQPAAVPLQQPGAPGQATKTVTGPTVGTAHHDPTAADIDFMQGMIMHHSQAVEMVGLMQGRTQNPQLLEMGKRISISQGDEIKFMKRWLAFYEHPVADDPMGGMDMSKMDMSHMDMAMPMMPGMLSPAQMAALRNARGAEFDHLFLTGMIQHHTGALSMVKDLFQTPGAGHDPQLFDFTAEIDTMKNMLAKEKP
jgi:uncharacterized protein (DUF305 family)